MKSILKILSMLSIALMVFVSSCGDDEPTDPTDDGGTTDTSAPSVTINAPTAGAIGAAGSAVVVSAAASDNVGIVSVNVTLGNGTVEVVNEDITEFTDPLSFSYNENITIPADVVLGGHTLTITATDEAGNSGSATVDIEAYPVYEAGMTTLLITSVPDQVADYSAENTIHMVGAHQEWNVEAADYPLLIHTDSEGTSTFYVQVANTGVDGFKFVRGTAWDMVEKDADGKELDNRSVAADLDKAEFTIGSWRDFNPEVSNWSNANYFDGTGFTTHTLTGNVGPSITGQAAIASVSYVLEEVVEEGDNVEVSSGDITLDGEGNFSEEIDISSLELGSYNIIISAEDVDGNVGREDKALGVVEFPCDDSGLDDVAATETRLLVSVPATEDDIYITGKIQGADIWGGNLEDDAYKMTKISDGCYYIDVQLNEGDIVQFIRVNAGYADWWRGQATNTEGSDATANFNVTAASSGTTELAYYQYWREEPAE